MNRDRIDLSLELIDTLLEDGAVNTAQSEIRSLRAALQRKQEPTARPFLLTKLQKKILALFLLWITALLIVSFIIGAAYSCDQGGGTLSGGLACKGYEVVQAQERDGQLYKIQDYSIANISIQGVRYAD